MNQRCAVITGMGVVAPQATGVTAFWELLTAGRSATRAMSHFDASAFRSRVAAECDFDAAAEGLTQRQLRQWDRTTQLAIVAAREAVAASGVSDDVVPDRAGVVVGTACGMTWSLDHEYAVVSDHGREWLVDDRHGSPYLYDYFLPSSMAVELAWLVGAEGPVSVVPTGCTSGIDALAHGADLIREGSADVVLAGASDAPISPITVACFDAIKATTARNDEPETASRPFDRTRNGFVLGEGAAMLVLEELGHAQRRGANIRAELASAASRCNAYSMTGLRADGAEMADAIRTALARARVDRSDVDYISGHGSSTRQNDVHETAAFKSSLGEHAYTTPVSSIKSMIGHSLGAIGALETVACVLAVERGVIPPTANLHEPDPECDLDYVPVTARDHRVDVAVNVGSGFGGFQSAMVLTAPGRVR